VMSTREAKAALGLFPKDQIDESFLVLNAHRNQPRKRIDLTLKAFALFAEGKPPGVQLYLHMGTEDLGWNVLKLARRYGIFDRVILTKNSNDIPGVSSEQLNLIYNACDIGLSTSAAEGWGLPNFEHAAAGKPQIVPRTGALAEIWEGCAELVEPSAEVVYEHVLTEAKAVRPADVAAALERLYRDHAHRAEVALACYRRATRPENDWGEISRQWHALFQEVLEGPTRDVANRKSGLLLEALARAPDGPVAEIGCIRQEREEPVDGFSTYWLARRCRELGRTFRSFDLDTRAVGIARAILEKEGLPGVVECRDGVEALTHLGPVAFLHLDGPDNPAMALDQYRAAELLPGAVLVIDDAHNYWCGAHGKATAVVRHFEGSPLPLVPFRIVPTESGYAALVATFPTGKPRGSLNPRDDGEACPYEGTDNAAVGESVVEAVPPSPRS
jgi:predicted O-methyltransferase YrrM